jgi:Secretion system C-terminal sorting domain/SprB repeat
VLGASIARAKNVSCSGSFDGMALALGSGGVLPYTYSWSPSGNTASLATGLSAATYTVLITDATGCNAVAITNITQPSVLRVSDTLIAAIAAAYPSGGTPPYTYSWAPGGVTTAMASGISGGTYTVTVTDFNGCKDSAVVLLKQPLSAGLGLSLDYLGSTCADNPSYATFAVLASSVPNTVFHNCVVDIHYSNSEFYPDSLLAGSSLQVYPDANFIFYDFPTMTQLSDSVIEIKFGDSTESASVAATENILDDSAVPLFYIQLQIQSPCQSGIVSFTNTITTMSESTYTDSAFVGGRYVYSDSAYTTVYTNTIVASPSCTSTISISNTIPPINAGTNAQSIPENSSVFTINGNGFGGSIGNILVPDANTGSTNPSLLLDSMDILSWSNNQIVVRMPSYLLRYPLSTPGSGHLQIFNACGDTISVPLTINYNIEDTCASSHSKLRKNISMVNDTVSLLFRCDTSISNHPQIQSVVLQAIETWNCYTGVNWKMGNDTTGDTIPKLDGVSSIYFVNSLSGGAAMSTTPHVDTLCNNTGDSMTFVYDVDIAIKRIPYPSCIWNYNTSDSLVPGNPHHFYFFDALMHELGHAQLLNHINDESSLMWCELDSNRRRTLLGGTYPGPQTLYGAFDVVSTDSAFTNSCKDGTLQNIPRICIDPTLDVPSIANNSFNLNLYPNPANSNIILAYTLANNAHVQFMLTDCIGRVITKLPDEDKSPGNYKVQVNTSNLSQGVYLVIANFNGEVQTIKFIKI